MDLPSKPDSESHISTSCAFWHCFFDKFVNFFISNWQKMLHSTFVRQAAVIGCEWALLLITSAHEQTLLGHASWFHQSRARRNIWWVMKEYTRNTILAVPLAWIWRSVADKNMKTNRWDQKSKYVMKSQIWIQISKNNKWNRINRVKNLKNVDRKLKIEYQETGRWSWWRRDRNRGSKKF